MTRTTDPMAILRIARKKKRVTARQGEADYWVLEDLVKKGLLHRTIPTHKKAYGWPVYILTKRGHRVLETCRLK